MSSPLYAVIFDLDGTLSNTWPPALAAFRSAISQFAQRPFSDAELMALAGPAEEGILQALFPAHWEACFERYLSGFEQRLVDGEILFPGVRDTLDTLVRDNVTMAIVSGKSQRAVEAALFKAGISDYFFSVRGGCAMGDRKALDLAETIEKMGFPPSSVAYIGDTKGDIIAAKTAGVLPIGASWAPTVDELSLHDAGAFRVFSKVKEFQSWCQASAPR